jgi:alpha-methylacyl-CoA racemase
VRRAPPERGEGGHAALEDWGFSAAEIARIAALGLGCR